MGEGVTEQIEVCQEKFNCLHFRQILHDQVTTSLCLFVFLVVTHLILSFITPNNRQSEQAEPSLHIKSNI